MITWTNATNTTATFTFTTTNTSSTAGTLTYHVLKSKPPRKNSEPKPKLERPRSRFREGDTVRVLPDGILHGRVGTVAGFMDTVVGVVVFVSWPGGGWTTFKDESLELAKPRKS